MDQLKSLSQGPHSPVDERGQKVVRNNAVNATRETDFFGENWILFTEVRADFLPSEDNT